MTRRQAVWYSLYRERFPSPASYKAESSGGEVDAACEGFDLAASLFPLAKEPRWKSVNVFINRAIEETMEQDKAPQEAAGSPPGGPGEAKE